MSWLSLGTAALGALGGIFGGDDEQTVTQQLPAHVEQFQRPIYGDVGDAYADRSTYIPYDGQRIATPAPEYTVASDIIRNNIFAGLPALLQSQGLVSNLANAPIDVNQVGIEGFSGDALSRFMTPHANEVEDRVISGLQDDFNRQDAALRQRNKYAGRAGGGRGDLMEFYQNESQQDTLADTRAKLRQAAFESATNSFQNERDAALTAQRANQSANLQGQQLGIQKILQAAGLNADLGNNIQQQIITGSGALSGVGDLWRGLAQQNLDQRYADFVAQRDYPFTLAGQATGAVQGMHVPTTTTTVAPNNPLTSGLGGASVGLGLGKQLSNIFGNQGTAVGGYPNDPVWGGL